MDVLQLGDQPEKKLGTKPGNQQSQRAIHPQRFKFELIELGGESETNLLATTTNEKNKIGNSFGLCLTNDWSGTFSLDLSRVPQAIALQQHLNNGKINDNLNLCPLGSVSDSFRFFVFWTWKGQSMIGSFAWDRARARTVHNDNPARS